MVLLCVHLLMINISEIFYDPLKTYKRKYGLEQTFKSWSDK